ncbi:MAG: HAMP domain-containing protein [Deltaproteobacteria bacterium]|nr:HAMP domain-containing protein [Deltaproteobacteria bacterium]
MRRGSGTARRLGFAFGALFLVFGAAAYFAMAALSEVHALLHGVKHHEAAVKKALELASAVRDQYAHQAHTIILGNDTHLGYYRQARGRVLDLTSEVRAFAGTPQEQRHVDDIARATTELDAIFQDNIVPAVLSGDRPTILREHAHAQELVSSIQDHADLLAARYEAAIAGFETHATAVENEAVQRAWLLFIGAMVLAIALGAYVGNSVARPVATLEAGAAALARGDLDAQIQLDRNDEFGRLAQQFNRMTAALKAHQRHRVESEKLAGIGRLAAGVAHEINNPIAVILGYARVLRRNADAKLDEDLAVIEDEALRCQEIVQGLLDLARPVRPEAQPVSLRELCQEAIARLEEAQRLQGVEVEIDGAATIQGSPQRLRQVILNLLQNAADAAGPHGRVRAVIRREENGAAVSVSDSGPGLSEEIRARLFEPFFTTKTGGTGLGLAISKAIALEHGGDIEVSSGAGGGATFILRLPASPKGVD